MQTAAAACAKRAVRTIVTSPLLDRGDMKQAFAEWQSADPSRSNVTMRLTDSAGGAPLAEFTPVSVTFHTSRETVLVPFDRAEELAKRLHDSPAARAIAERDERGVRFKDVEQKAAAAGAIGGWLVSDTFEAVGPELRTLLDELEHDVDAAA